MNAKLKGLVASLAFVSLALLFMGCPNATNAVVKTATIGTVTITGAKDTALTVAAEVTVTVSGDKFKAIPADTDVAPWITNLPAGLTAKTKTAVAAGATKATIAISGTPTAVSTDALKVTIPAAHLASGAALTAGSNIKAKFAITIPAAAKSAALTDVTVTGTANAALTAVNVTVTLRGDTFTAIAADTAVTWITNLPVGLTAKITPAVAANAATATIAISGTPTAASTDALKVTIPAASLVGGADITAAANLNAKFEIAAAPAVAKSAALTDVAISGTVGTALSGEVTVTLTGDKFKALAANADAAAWITNLPAPLTAKIKADVAADATTATIAISGTPTATATDALTVTIPAASLAGGADITAAANTNAKFDIAAAAVTKSATVGNVTIIGTKGTLFAAPMDVTVTHSGDKFKAIAADEVVTAWITNLPTGLTAKIKTVVTGGDITATIKVEGTPGAISSDALVITIPAAVLDGNAAITVTSNPSAKFDIT
jgi:hypothetical protein